LIHPHVAKRVPDHLLVCLRFFELTAHLKGNDPRLLLLAGLLEAFTARWLLSNYGISLTASA
jgi:hypothetical protein